MTVRSGTGQAGRPRAVRHASVLGIALAGTLLVSGCTGSPAPDNAAKAGALAGGTPSVTASVPEGDSGGAAASPSASPRASASSSPQPSSLLDAVKRPNCFPGEAAHNLGLAGGALRTYVATPAERGTLAPDNAAAVKQAHLAVRFAQDQFSRAEKALKGCPASVDPLASVLGQTLTLLTKFDQELKAGQVPATRPAAAIAMYENVLAQATRLRLKVAETVPTPAQLAG